MANNIISKYYFLIFLTLVYCKVDYTTDKPAAFKSCEIYKPNFTKCHTDSIQLLFQNLVKGIPGFNIIPNFDPIALDRIIIDEGNSESINVKVELSNILGYGFKDTVVKESKVSRKDFSWKTTFILPKFKIEGDYKMKGRILLLQLNGSGRLTLEIENLNGITYTSTQLYSKGGFTFYNVTEVHAMYNITGLNVNITNLFNGVSELEDNINGLFNENWKILHEAFQPVIIQTLENILKDILGKIFDFYPATFFVSDLPKV